MAGLPAYDSSVSAAQAPAPASVVVVLEAAPVFGVAGLAAELHRRGNCRNSDLAIAAVEVGFVTLRILARAGLAVRHHKSPDRAFLP